MLRLQKVSKFKKQQLSKKVRPSKQQTSFSNPVTKYPTYEQQFDPEFIYKHFVQDSQSEYLQRLHEANYSNRQFEDSVLTTFLNRKIILVRLTLMSWAISSMFLSIFSKEIYYLQTQVLILHSVISLFMLVLVIIKYLLQEQLKKKQLLRQKLQNQYIKFVKQMSIQIIILLMHPNLSMRGVTISVQQPIYGEYIDLKINTVLEIVMQIRIYLVLVSIITSSVYCNTRANRLCRIYSTKANLFFGIKSLFEYRPLTFLTVLYSSLVITLGQMISLSQRDYQKDFLNFQNSIWFVIITMGTVGYGDYSPMTYLGRIISFSAAISGIIMSSLLILTLSRYLSMSNSENKSHVTLKRLQLRKLLQKYSKQTINFTTKMMFQNRGRLSDKNEAEKAQENKQIMEQLKRKTQKVKFSIRRIKNMVDTDNLKEEISRMFQALSQSLNEIYNFQQQYSQLLIQLYKKQKDTINEIQFSFTTEIQNIIKDK